MKESLKKNKMDGKILKADIIFDLVGFSIFMVHLYMSFIGITNGILPDLMLVVFFAASRTSMAAMGHYHCHRKSDGLKDWGDALFDMTYVGASLITKDGHVMLHHMVTNSPADVKRTVFTSMLDLPRFMRIPIFTLHKFT